MTGATRPPRAVPDQGAAEVTLRREAGRGGGEGGVAVLLPPAAALVDEFGRPLGLRGGETGLGG